MRLPPIYVATNSAIQTILLVPFFTSRLESPFTSVTTHAYNFPSRIEVPCCCPCPSCPIGLILPQDSSYVIMIGDRVKPTLGSRQTYSKVTTPGRRELQYNRVRTGLRRFNFKNRGKIRSELR